MPKNRFNNKILDYIRNELDDAERLGFEAVLQNNEELKTQLNQMKELEEDMVQIKQMRALQSAHIQANLIRKQQLFQKILVVTLALSLISILVWFLTHNSIKQNKNLPTPILVPKQNLSTPQVPIAERSDEPVPIPNKKKNPNTEKQALASVIKPKEQYTPSSDWVERGMQPKSSSEGGKVYNSAFFINPSIALINSDNTHIKTIVELLNENKGDEALQLLKEKEKQIDIQSKYMLEGSAYLIKGDIKEAELRFFMLVGNSKDYEPAAYWGLGWVEILQKKKPDLYFDKVILSRNPLFYKKATLFLNQ